ncbi:MAG: hypothetical protein LUC41_06575 [Clostridiales bacterium]|nr:hypothetical protein [Clostridiales bacterium]
MYNPNENRFGDPEDQFERPPVRNMSTMAAAGLACGIIGLVLCETGWFGIMFGALGILFGFLSKGAADKPCKQARYGMIIGLVALLIGIVMIIVSFRTVIVNYGSIQNYYNMFLQQFYGTGSSSGNLL